MHTPHIYPPEELRRWFCVAQIRPTSRRADEKVEILTSLNNPIFLTDFSCRMRLIFQMYNLYLPDKNELAVHTCSDDKENAKFCKAWKLFGMCDIHASLMREHCTKTCGFCDLDKNGETNKVNEETVDKKSSQFGH